MKTKWLLDHLPALALCVIVILLLLQIIRVNTRDNTPPRNADGTYTALGAAHEIRSGNAGGYPLTIIDTVYDVHQADSGQWYLNFGGTHPEAVLGVWVPKIYTKEKKRGWFAALEGQRVKVTGTARSYKGRPELVVRDLDDEIIPQAGLAAVLQPETAHKAPTTALNP